MSHLEITEVILVHCNIVNNNYQEDSRVFFVFVRNMIISFDNFFRYFTQEFYIFKTCNSEFSHFEVWFTDQNFELMVIEDNITLVIN